MKYHRNINFSSPPPASTVNAYFYATTKLQHNNRKNTSDNSAKATIPHSPSTAISSLCRKRLISTGSRSTVFTLTSNSLSVIPSGSNGVSTGGLGPNENSTARRHRKRTANFVQGRGAVVGVIAGLVELVCICETQVLALSILECRVARRPCPIRQGGV